jgi:hypothetical protein
MQDMTVLARMAASQHGLLSRPQLEQALGSRHRIETLQRAGFLERRRRGVFAVAGALPTWQAEVMAACLATRRLVVASHRSAIRLWGLRSVDDEIDVSIRYPGQIRLAGVNVRRIRDLTWHDFTYIEGVPVTTPARTLCDAGLVFGADEVERMTQHAIAKEIVSPAELWTYRRRVGRRGRTGVGALDRALVRLPERVGMADSGPEIEMARLCADAGLPTPVWQHPVVARGRRYLVDFAYPEQRLAIEYDEFEEHPRPEKFESDRARQNDLQEVGWTVIRFVWSDLRDRPAEVIARIRRFLVL